MNWLGRACWAPHKDGKTRPGVVLRVCPDGRLLMAMGRGAEDPRALRVGPEDHAGEILRLKKPTYFWPQESTICAANHITEPLGLVPLSFLDELRRLYGFPAPP